MTLRPCLDCGVPTDNGARCPTHAPDKPSGWTTHNPAYDSAAYRNLRRTVIRAWVLTHGWSCPGWKRPAHSSIDLQLDHKEALAAGGAILDPDNAGVLCGTCNRAKGARRAA